MIIYTPSEGTILLYNINVQNNLRFLGTRVKVYLNIRYEGE